MNSKYEEKNTQKARLLGVLKSGKKVTQIDLEYYLRLRNSYFNPYPPKTDVVDAIAELGIANLPARIYCLKKDGYNIKTEDIKIVGRYGNTHYAIYSLNSEIKN